MKSDKSPALEINESTFQSQVIELAHVYQYRVAHFRGVRVQRAGGGIYYQTPVQADGAGFPDLVLTKEGRVIFAELKSEKGKISPDQQIWLDVLKEGGAECYCWRPSDWDKIQAILQEQIKRLEEV